jgi:tetratricopeptide (TPR) repeat protein
LQTVGRFRDAEEAGKRALGHVQLTGDADHAAIVVMDLGRLHLNRGQWPLAAAQFREAVERFRKMDHPLGVAAALYNLSDALRWSGNLTSSDAALEEATTALERAESPYLEVHLRVGRADSALARGDAGAALQTGGEALRLAQETDYETGEQLARLSLGRTYRALKRHDDARRDLEAALAGFDSIGEALEAARCRGELAAIAAELGDREKETALRDAAEAEFRRLESLPWLDTVASYERSTLRAPKLADQ